jgi:amino acid transporter/mannitol/fructose-specific phosphotransferase system IIA component (Ntr-type)
MVGSGIFVLPGLAAGKAGPMVWLSYLFAGLLVLPSVLSKAELATAMPVAGGTYVYVDRAMGPWMGTITGLGTWFSLMAKTAFALIGLSTYLQILTGFPSKSLALVILVCLVGVNLMGVGKASWIQVIIVTISVGSLLLFGLVSMPFVEPSHFEPSLPFGVGGIVSGAAFVFVSYSGVTKVCSVAEEVRDPDRNIPLGMLSAHFSVMFLYALCAYVIVGLVPMESLGSDLTPVASAGDAMGGPGLRKALAVVAVLGLSSMCNAGILASSRYPFAMARDSLLPSRLGFVSERFSTPTVAIVLTGFVIGGLVLGLPVEKLAKLASGFKIFIFSVVNLAVILLRESNARWYRPSFKAPLYPGLQVFAILSGVGMLAALGLLAISGVMAAVLAGTIWYLVYARKRVTRESVLSHLFGEARALRETELAEAEDEETVQALRVIVPIFGDQDHTGTLILLATAFAPGALLEVQRLEEVPEQTALSDWLEEDTQMHRLAREAQRIADETGTDLEFRDILTHNAKRALLEHAQATKASWIVMRWPDRSQLHYLVRHPMAWWLEHPPCDLAIFRDRGATNWHHVLVLAEPGPYDSLVMRIASRLAALHDGDITILGLCESDSDAATLQGIRDYHRHLIELTTTDTKSLVLPTPDRLATIMEISGRYDLLVMGAPPERSIRGIFFGSFEDHVAEEARCSVLRLKTPDPAYHHGEAMSESPRDDFERFSLTEVLVHATLQPCQRVGRKDQLFKLLAKQLSKADGDVQPDAVEKALWDRDKRSNTALSGGVALFAATSANVTRVSLAVTTLKRPVDFLGKDNRGVDVVLVILAQAGQRQVQLWVLDRLARMLIWPHFLELLRAAQDEAALRKVLMDADERLNAELSG